MLVLTRKKGESFLIGESIEITVVEIENGKVKIGIEAHKKHKIVRKEIIDEVKDVNKTSVMNMNSDDIRKLFSNEIKLTKDK